MIKNYYVNGWKEGKNYFMNLGQFSGSELERMENGEIITKGNNEFCIEVKEVY